MSESMIEKVAKALNAEITQPQYAVLDTVPGRDAALEAVMGLARAAVVAMRDPTDAMLDAAVTCDRGGFGRRRATVGEVITNEYRAMIEAALTDGTEARSP